LLPWLTGASGEPEDQLKAAVVLSFLRYGEWPQPLANNAPIQVGVWGRASFTDALRGALEGKSVNDHPIRILALKSPLDCPGCQAIYFASDRGEEIQAALEGLRLAHALSIGESKDFLRWGGAVNLLVVDGRMGFEVNLEALERSGVTISSRLLRFGQVLNRRKGDRS
jgi:hypothetical protein